jgi:hypothetical protein
MDTLHRRCAGLDVHQKEIVACRRIVSGRRVRSELERAAVSLNRGGFPISLALVEPAGGADASKRWQSRMLGICNAGYASS